MRKLWSESDLRVVKANKEYIKMFNEHIENLKQTNLRIERKYQEYTKPEAEMPHNQVR